ncbi:unnamed protein product [Coregonus sp. 'balchen']|nr:unnamed protein product [Coregonus sp. 'balchen']
MSLGALTQSARRMGAPQLWISAPSLSLSPMQVSHPAPLSCHRDISMAMFSGSERFFWNDSEQVPEDLPLQRNSSGGWEEEDTERNYYAMLYSLLILAIVFGNVLVCLAVVRERSLQTTTNYLVVSLAVADLLVASLVMPWAVYLEVRVHWVGGWGGDVRTGMGWVGEGGYLEVVGGAWLFSRMYCNIFVTLDVMMCTASILNLCAISIDR